MRRWILEGDLWIVDPAAYMEPGTPTLVVVDTGVGDKLKAQLIWRDDAYVTGRVGQEQGLNLLIGEINVVRHNKRAAGNPNLLAASRRSNRD